MQPVPHPNQSTSRVGFSVGTSRRLHASRHPLLMKRLVSGWGLRNRGHSRIFVAGATYGSKQKKQRKNNIIIWLEENGTFIWGWFETWPLCLNLDFCERDWLLRVETEPVHMHRLVYTWHRHRVYIHQDRGHNKFLLLDEIDPFNLHLIRFQTESRV